MPEPARVVVQPSNALLLLACRLDELNAPATAAGGQPLNLVQRLDALLGDWQDAIRAALPGRVDGGASEGGELQLTLAEIAQGLEAARDERERELTAELATVLGIDPDQPWATVLDAVEATRPPAAAPPGHLWDSEGVDRAAELLDELRGGPWGR